MSPPEVLLWLRVRRNLLGYVVKRQQPFAGYVLDFYIAKLGVAIEVDGQIHEFQVQHDELRDSKLEALGLIIIRIPARRIFEDLPSVMESLRFRLNEIEEYRVENPVPKRPKKARK